MRTFCMFVVMLGVVGMVEAVHAAQVGDDVDRPLTARVIPLVERAMRAPALVAPDSSSQ